MRDLSARTLRPFKGPHAQDAPKAPSGPEHPPGPGVDASAVTPSVRRFPSGPAPR